jgi:hypothetical protein
MDVAPLQSTAMADETVLRHLSKSRRLQSTAFVIFMTISIRALHSTGRSDARIWHSTSRYRYDPDDYRTPPKRDDPCAQSSFAQFLCAAGGAVCQNQF